MRVAPGIVVIDDIFPNHPAQADRLRRTSVWMGDVWKLAYILGEYRPDLHCLPIDCNPGGMLIVAGLDPDNDVPWEQYNAIVRRSSAPPDVLLPVDVTGRFGAYGPTDPLVPSVLASLRQLRTRGADRTLVKRVVGQLRRAAASGRWSDSGGPWAGRGYWRWQGSCLRA